MGNYPPRKLADGTTCTSGPNCRLHGRIASASPLNDFNKRLDTFNKPKVNPYENKTPVDVDTELAEVLTRLNRADAKIASQTTVIKRYDKVAQLARESLERSPNSPQRQRVVEVTQIDYDNAVNKLNVLKAESASIEQEAVPMEAEFMRRGGWNRAFLVVSSDGHVHKSRSCHSCNIRTRYALIPELSGKNENEIVEQAGVKACTECYKSAPVEYFSKPTSIIDPAKKVDESVKAAADAKKAAVEAKNIKSVDGRPFTLETYSGVIKTVRTAETYASNIRTYQIAKEAGKWDPRPEQMLKEKTDFEIILKTLAHKKGTSVETERSLIEEKAQKKYKKEWK